MPHFQWNENWMIGVEAIDNDHRRFADLVNRLDEAIAEGASKDKIVVLAAELVADATQHFAHEEAVLARHGYPDLDSHRDEHRRMLEFIHAAESRLAETDDRAEMAALSSRICDALVVHLVDWDMDYRWYLVDKGIARYERHG